MTGRRPLIIGEVLFDHFPDGQLQLGGAPFNVAWNLQGFGLPPLFISSVGQDEEGEEIRQRMQAWGLETRGLQQSGKWPTGQVRVELVEGQPSYDILNEQAYDDIHYPDFSISSDEYALLYVGSLAYRNETTRATIDRLIHEHQLPRFVDINIRQPWFDRDWIPALMGDAKWIKLNDHELAWIANLECHSREEIRAATEKLRKQYGGRNYVITCGSAGAYSFSEEGESCFVEASRPEKMVDTVGAGDAFTSATIYGVIYEYPWERTLQLAARFAAKVCSLRGATTEDRSHYTGLDL